MGRYAVRRLMEMLLMAFFTTIVVFGLLHLAPGDPISSLASPSMDRASIEKLRAQYGLDQPLPVQYLRWLTLLSRGDLGRSITSNEPINDMIMERFINTIKLTLSASVLAIVVGLVTGVAAAATRGSVIDFVTMSIAVIAFSTPAFWLGLILILIFSVWLGWLPAYGTESWKHLVLPTLSLGMAMAALLARITRSSMLEILRSDYIRTARAKGMPESAVLFIHALKNALIPILTTIGNMMGALLAGAVVTETIFSYSGLGFTLVRSLFLRDYPVIQASLLITSLSYLFMNFLVDISYSLVDPRIRYD